jgi:signal transduction histidine kinase
MWPMDRWRRWRIVLAAATALALLLGGAATALVRAQDRARDELAERFAVRGVLAAHFAESYLEEVVAAERRRAAVWLGRRDVRRAQFIRTLEAFDFQAALLLDERGRVLYSSPLDPKLVGQDLDARYAHLEAAVAGRVAVSNVVPSASAGVPVVAVAVPFPSGAGRRVLSGAFALDRTPLAAYLRNALPIAGSRLYVVDGNGRIVVANTDEALRNFDLATFDPHLSRAMGAADRGTAPDPAGDRFFAVEPIPSTPWRVVVSAPEAELFAPLAGWARWAPWLLFAGLALAGVLVAALLVRLVAHRARLAQANEQLALKNVELQELDRLKDEFVALVSHELRTPLTSVLGYIRLLLRGRAGELEPEQRRLLEVADRNAQRLLRLVGDLLFAARADAGKLFISLGDEDLADIVAHAAESAAPDAREREIELEVEADGPLPVTADRTRLVQLLDNLISNALKFTPAGGSVHVRALAAGASAMLEVEDSGIGIPEAEQSRLFGRFFRASTATDREIQGTGLGLSVAKTIVELHGGTISCTSEEGRGTTFRVELPLADAAVAAA